MARSQGKPEPVEWVGQRLAAVGPSTVEAWGGEYTYTFAGLPELATDWHPFTLDIVVPYDPTPAAVDRLLERWHWYRPRHTADSVVFREAVLALYRNCDDFLPREASDADILRRVTRARIEVCTTDRREYELYAELFAEFAGEHGPLLAWDERLSDWDQLS